MEGNMSKEVDLDLEELAEEFEMTPEEIQEILDAVDDFEEYTLSSIAGTERYELIPTTDNYGNPLTKKQFDLARRECSRLGATPLYVLEMKGYSVVVNAKTLKMGIISEEVH
jgi:hypothetical protein